MVELWLKSNITGIWESIDIGGDVSIAITKSFEEIEDFTTRNSTFSKTFSLPQTKNNNKFFESSFEVNSSSFATQVVVDGVVKYGGADVFFGQARLSKIINEVGGGFYEVFLTQSLPDFANTLQDVKLIDLDYSGITHFLNYSAITSTWSYTGGSYNDYAGISGKLLYPLAHYGYDTGQYYGEFSDSASGFTNVSYPLSIRQFAPWVNVKYLIDRIFDKVGFTYDSEFFNTEYFKGIFTIAKTNNTMGAKIGDDETENANVFLVSTNTGYYDTDGTNIDNLYTQQFYLDIENNDPLNIFTPSLSTTQRENYFTTIVSGTYRTKWRADFFLQNPTFPLYINVAMKDLDDGTIYANVGGLTIFPSTSLSTYEDMYFTANIPANRRVGLFYSRVSTAGNPNATLGVFRAGWELYASPVLSTSETMLLQDNLPAEISSLDFFKGIVSLFNLVVIPDGDRNLKIEKWDTYFSQGNSLDWSDKLDLSSPYELLPTNDLQKEYIIKYQNSEDWYSKLNIQDRNQVFGTTRFISKIPYHSGVSEIVIPFDPLPTIVFDGMSDTNMIIPHIYDYVVDTENGTISYQPLGSKLRLGFYNGLMDFTITGATKTWYLLSGSTAVGHTNYPAISNLSSYEYSASTFSDLNLQNQYMPWQQYTDTYVGYTNQDVFTKFWLPRVEPLYEADTKILTGTFRLTPVEVNNIQFNDRVYFLGAWWRLLDMTDADITDESLVSCRWIKLPYTSVETSLIPPTYEQAEPITPPSPSASTYSITAYTGNNLLDICADSSPTIAVYSNCSVLSGGCSVFSDSGAANPIEEGTYLKPIGSTTIYQVAEYGIIQQLTNC